MWDIAVAISEAVTFSSPGEGQRRRSSGVIRTTDSSAEDIVTREKKGLIRKRVEIPIGL
jgi:hypothetical protein